MLYGVDQVTVDVLRNVRARIADPGRWTVGVAARDENGQPCLLDSGLARQWCLSGAVALETFESDPDTYNTLYCLIEQAIRDTVGRYMPLDQFNDRYGHLAVLGLLDGLIAELDVRQSYAKEEHDA